ncbi:MAG: IS3 family transposase [Serratia symbiotica]|nr:IS3 family transposase [Serratia symbiotica]
MKQAIAEYLHDCNTERIGLKPKGLSSLEYRTQSLKAA